MTKDTKTIQPRTLKGTINPPPAKSVSHRAFILVAFAENGSQISNVLQSADTLATKATVEGMGAEFREVDNSFELVKNVSHNIDYVDCKNSGTTLRLMTAILCLFDGETVLTGDSSLITRPMKPLIEALTKLGAIIESDAGTPPIKIIKGIDPQNTYTDISGSVSSQYISGLLLQAALREGITSRIELIPPVVSKPYIDLTIKMLSQIGISVREEGNVFEVIGKKFGKIKINVPSDMSSAAFFIVAGAIGNNEIRITNIDHSLPQADSSIIEIVRSTGAEIIENGSELIVKGNAEGLQPFEVDLSQAPDLFPILCVLASCCSGTSKIYNAEHVRVKEVDRISVMLENLEKVGIDFVEHQDGAEITGGTISGGVTLKSHHDHRIAMACAILGTQATETLEIEDYDCVDVSYPNFYNDLEYLMEE